MPTVDIDPITATRIAEMQAGFVDEHGQTRTDADLVSEAVRRVHRGFVGLPAGEDGAPDPALTGPFLKWASDRPAEVLLRQIDPKRFRLAQPFRFEKGEVRFDVPEEDVTDLASVPGFLTWLVPRYGRHTLAALLHDHLQRVDDVTSFQADEIFRDAMGDTGVPLARRWVMWSAVALRTEWKLGGLHAVRAGLWVALFAMVPLVGWPLLALIVAFGFGWSAVAFAIGAIGAGIVLPIALSVLWGRLWKLGAVGGVVLLFLTFPVVMVLLSLGVYVGVEAALEHLLVRPSKRNAVMTRNA